MQHGVASYGNIAGLNDASNPEALALELLNQKVCAHIQIYHCIHIAACTGTCALMRERKDCCFQVLSCGRCDSQSKAELEQPSDPAVSKMAAPDMLPTQVWCPHIIASALLTSCSRRAVLLQLANPGVCARGPSTWPRSSQDQDNYAD